MLGFILMPSTVEHPNAGLSVFPARTILKGETIAAYYRTLVYTYLSKHPLSMRLDGKGTMAVSISKFNR